MNTTEQCVKDVVFGYIKLSNIKANIPKPIMLIIIKYYHTPKTLVYVIGHNLNAELGLLHNRSMVKTLTLQPHQYNIHQIYNGNTSAIYSDYHNKNNYSAGCTTSGQCCLGEYNKYCTEKLTQITSFVTKNITIKRIFKNVNAKNTFWIDIDDKIYANGMNGSYQFGLRDHNKNQSEAVPIKCLKNVKDIKCGLYYTLCLDKTGNVYSCGIDGGYGAGYGHTEKVIKQFTKIQELHDIIQITAGMGHSMFLSSSGMVYVCGGTIYHSLLGLGHAKPVRKPIVNDFFIQNKIKIIDIASGYDFNLCTDANGKVYGFGCNSYGQCGVSSLEREILLPTEIKMLQNECVIQIKCGTLHSYALSKQNKYYFWGFNRHNQCIMNTNGKSINSPCLVNAILKKELNNKIIKDIFLGNDNTQIIVYR